MDGNPLVAQAQSQTTGVTGIGVLESANDLANGVKDGSWVEAGLGGVGVGLEVLSLVTDPIGTLAQYGVSWLIEHVKPLKDCLDWLAGNPPVIQSFSDTWANVSKEVNAIAGDLANEAKGGTAGWNGEGADAYRGEVAEQTDALAGAASLCDGISTGVMVMGQVVAAVRETVRDLIATLVGKLISWALEEACTLGFATPVVAAQATTAITNTINKVSTLIRKLIKTISNVGPKVRKIVEKLGEIIEKLSKLAKRLGKGGGHTGSSAARKAEHAADDVHVPKEHTTSSSAHDTTSPSSAKGAEHPDTSTSPSKTDGSSADGGSHPSSTADGGSSRGTGENGPNRPRDPRESDTPLERRVCENDPIDVSSGEMVLGQTDVELAAVLPLVLRRVHVSSYRAGLSFGRSWASTVDQRLEFDAQGVVFLADDGMRLVYPAPEPHGEVFPRTGPRWPLAVTEDGYTIRRRDTGVTLRFAGSESSRSFLTAMVDRSGNRIDFDRPDGVLTRIRHSGGYQVNVTAEAGRVTGLRLAAASGPDVLLATYRYDGPGDLVAVGNSSGRAQAFTYDREGRITQWTDRNGEWYRYFYDAQGRCVANQGSGGFLNGTFTYDPAGRSTRFTDALGHSTVYEFDAAGNVTLRVDPLGRATRQAWSADGLLLSRTDPLGNTTRYRYDSAGNLLALTRPDGTEASAEYNDLGRPVTTVDPDGAVWHREYDEAGRVVTVVDPMGARTRCEYDEKGQLAAVTDALGRTRRTETDAAGLPVVEIAADGSVYRYGRDQFGRVTTITDPMGGVTRLSWTVEGKLLSQTAPDGSVRRWRYDGEGNRIASIDPEGRVSAVETTHFDLPAAEIRPDGTRLTFGYDPLLRLTSVTNPDGMTWRYEYDAAGQLVEETDFMGRRVQYVHDAAGNLVQRTNGAGEVVRFERDVLGRLVRRSHGEVVESFEYDAAGRMSSARNAHAELVFTRDARGRVLRESVNGRAVESVYDPLGRRTVRRTPTGAETRWEYGAGAQPVKARLGERTLSFGYDAAGRETERLLDTGTILAQAWDANHRLVGQTVSAVITGPSGTAGRAQLVQQRGYEYARDGRLTAVRDHLLGDRVFELDQVARITGVQGTGWSERYSYDTSGNIASAEWPGSAAAHEVAGVLVKRAGNIRYQYDSQGRVVCRTRERLSAKNEVWRYEWDADDKLSGVVTPDGTRWRYRYDPLGRRIAKLRLAADGEIAERVDFTWDGMTLAEQVRDDAYATTWNWEPGSFRALSQTERVRGGERGQDWVDEAFYSIVTDLVGTPSELVDTTGTVVWRCQANLWGQEIAPATDGARTPLRFPGQYFDPETGLSYNNFRHYDPETGRYTSNDPLGIAGSPHPQAYVPNPTAAIDPMGLTPCKTYYSVQDPADAERLLNNGGEPWPSGFDHGTSRDEFGPGLYTWETREQAERYLERVNARGGNAEILEHHISGEDFDRLRSADLTTMDDDTATAIWNSEGRHGYDHVRRNTGNFGPENYFSSSVYHLLQTRRPT
ncbi:RHS repeat-associated core domain-containing protein [Amycolatopsis sp. NPDC059021]|uniref:RHS repeat-associated core domain-containing protein n=1 Tax=Amycolatopsis sp. NPDC059021 TaxID=3346704 RepID=UPI0036735536